jgi:hypothetical protein
MNNGTYSNKPRTHLYFVADILENLPDMVTFQPAGTAFQNKTNSPVTVNTVAYQPGEVMLADGQIQFYNGDTSQAVAAATNPLTMKSYFIAQGRSQVDDVAALPERPFWQSEKIPTNAPTTVNARLCQMDRNCAWVIGVPNAATSGNVNVVDNTTYGMTVAYQGHWAYRLNARNNPAVFPSFTVEGTWTELGIATTANQRDYIIQNMVYSINRHSQLWGALESEPIVALAIKANAGAGTQLSALLPGVVIPVAYKNGNTALPVNLTITNGIYRAIQAAITAGTVLATDRVVVANPSTAGNGTHASAQILLIALDRQLVATDRVRFVKYRIEVGLNEGFSSTVAHSKSSTDFEGYGLPRHVKLDYETYAELNKAWTVQLPSGNAFQYASDIVLTRPYLLVDIEWKATRESSTGHDTAETQLITLAVPCCDMTLRQDWEDFLNGFMADMPNTFFGGPAATDVKTFDFDAGGTNPCNASWLAPFKEVPDVPVP